VSQTKQLFFIALLPPQEVQEVANAIKQEFAEIYHSRAALKSPPHVTLQPPFYWEKAKLPDLEQLLGQFACSHPPIPMILDGFAAFRPRVIYINVLKTPELLAVQQALMKQLESSLGIVHQPSKNRPFAPHLTVGFKDLTKQNFYQAWSEFQQRSLHFEFIVPKLSLLAHNSKRWEIIQEFAFFKQETGVRRLN
jgi:2'-5' RNA ligase